MTVLLDWSDAVTVDDLRRAGFEGEPLRWADGGPAVDLATLVGSTDPVREAPRQLPASVRRSIAFARLARGAAPAEAALQVPRLQRELASAVSDDGGATAAALAGVVAVLDRRRLTVAERVLALSFDAYRAPLDALHPALGGLWGDPHQSAALTELGALLTDRSAERQWHQAPVSYRIVPRVLGQVRRALASLEQVAATALAGPVRPRTSRAGAGAVVYHHDAPVAAAIDAMSAAWADVGVLGHRHVIRLGRLAGTVEAVEAPNDAVDDLRRAAQPSLLGAAESSADPRRDLRPLTPSAYASHDSAALHLDEVLATVVWASVRAPAFSRLRLHPALTELATAAAACGAGAEGGAARGALELAGALSRSIATGDALHPGLEQDGGRSSSAEAAHPVHPPARPGPDGGNDPR